MMMVRLRPSLEKCHLNIHHLIIAIFNFFNFFNNHQHYHVNPGVIYIDLNRDLLCSTIYERKLLSNQSVRSQEECEKEICGKTTLQASTIWSPQIPMPSKYKECWNIQISRIETIPVRLTTALDCRKLFSVGCSVQWGIYCRETGNIVLATRIW